MGLPQKRDPEIFQEAMNLIQQGRPKVLRLFDEAVENEQQFREVKDVMVLDLNWEPDRIRWRNLHNDPSITVVSEKDMSVKIAIKTYIKFIRLVPVVDPLEALWADDEEDSE